MNTTPDKFVKRMRNFKVYGENRHTGNREFLGTMVLICYPLGGLVQARKVFKNLAKKIEVQEFCQ